MAKKQPTCLPWNIDKYIGEVRNRVHLVGVELEGGWDRSLPPGTRLEHDGSVFHAGFPAGYGDDCVKGELPSPPMEPARLSTWMNKYYPKFVDASCGLHVHMSFQKPTIYSMLMVPEYQQTIVSYLKMFGEEEKLPESHALWNRLAGKNNYCKLDFNADIQVQRAKSHNMGVTGNRYTAVNYAWTAYKTIEVRVLPMFASVDQAKRAVKRVLDVTNASLMILAREERKNRDLGFTFSDSEPDVNDHVSEVYR